MPRRSPGSRSAERESGVVLCQPATKISSENDGRGKHVDQVVSGES